MFSAVWPTLPRDFCNLSHWRVLDDGRTILLVNCSVTHAGCPPVEGFIRAEIMASCIIIEPRADNLGCNVAYLIKSDPKGNTPHFMVTKVQSARPLVLNNVSSTLEPLYASALMKSHLASRPRNHSSPITQKHRRRTLPSGSTEGKGRRSSFPTNLESLTKSGFSPTEYLRKSHRRKLTRFRQYLRSNYSVLASLLALTLLVFPSGLQPYGYIPLILCLALNLVNDIVVTPYMYSKPYMQKQELSVEAAPKEEDKVILKLKALTELSNQTTDGELKVRLNKQIAALLDRLEKL